MSRLPTVLVPHGNRSLPVLQLAAATAGLCRPLWLVDPADPDVAATRRLLERVGPVLRTDRPLAELVDDVATYEPAGAVAFRDADLVLVAELAERLGLAFHPPAVARALTDKLAQREALRRGGLPGPGIAHLPDPSDAAAVARLLRHVRFPAVLKPQRGSGSRHTFLVEHPEAVQPILTEILRSAGRAQPMVLEEYLPSAPDAADGPFADYVSVETLATPDGLVHVAVTGRTPPVTPFRETGFFLPSHLDDDQTAAVLATAGAALSALGVTTGCTHTEVKLTPAGPRVIEVNGRMGGGIRDLLLAASGRDLLVDHLRSALGLPVDLRGPVACRRIGYRFFYQPPLAARRLLALDGLRSLAELPGVVDITPHLAAGDALDPRQGSRAFLFSVVGATDDYAGVAEASRRLYELVEARYELALPPVDTCCDAPAGEQADPSQMTEAPIPRRPAAASSAALAGR